MNGNLLAFFLFFGGTKLVQGIGCAWSNEQCVHDTDCCSGLCWLAHEGTDPRCTRGSIAKSCVFDYHCKDGLECGKSYQCCSPYWQSCVQTKDCCDTEKYICRSVTGFIYKKCLYPAHGSTATGNISLLTLLVGFSLCVTRLSV
ncbi:uncharacterized protein LOC121374407 isoform X2 [Gigantopelta aegis]|uniref:uncharacterized protein LOC121374407 isoform X2 n=1 Tax=Gigantopelta aegis TaxID=1735272 RepID=UPI001B8891B8|nr:uncharacterized protein LOC121374407 isoform X2 [Gigantopelta aegis]